MYLFIYFNPGCSLPSLVFSLSLPQPPAHSSQVLFRKGRVSHEHQQNISALVFEIGSLLEPRIPLLALARLAVQGNPRIHILLCRPLGSGTPHQVVSSGSKLKFSSRTASIFPMETSPQLCSMFLIDWEKLIRAGGAHWGKSCPELLF